MTLKPRGVAAAIVQLFVGVSLVACGGGGGSSPAPAPAPAPTEPAPPPSVASVSGVAATGSPLTDGVVVLIDAQGTRRTAAIGSDGSYTFPDVSALKPPFVLRAMGVVGGQSVALHSPVLASDLNGGKVNVNPLTEMITAQVLGGTPDTLIDRNTADFSRITPAAASAATTSVKSLVEPLLASVASTDIDARTAEMTANHTGLDLVLDALNVTLTDNGYQVGTATGNAATRFDPHSGSGNGASPVRFTAAELALLNGVVAHLSGINARLTALTALFAAGVPSASALQPFFSTDFMDAGLDRDSFIADLRATDVSTQFSLVGASFDSPRIVQITDLDNITISFRVKPADGMRTRPWEQRSRLVRSGNQWLLRGDGELARASVSLMSRIVSTPMGESGVAQLPNVYTIQAPDSQNVMRTAYKRRIFDDTKQQVEDLWLGFPGEESFGLHGWSSKDQFFLPGGKAWRSTYQQYYGQASSQVRQYLVLTVPTQHVSASVASVLVTGPGLPAGGLTLTPPRTNRPRPNWIFAGDNYDWNAFDTGRCAQVNNATNPVPGCALDISQIQAGAEYAFTLRSATGTTLGVLRPRLPVKPRTPAELYQRRDELFPQFQLTSEQHFSYNNLFDDKGAFAVGKPLTLHWKLPTAPKTGVTGASYFVQYPDSNNVTRDASAFMPLYTTGAKPTSADFIVPTTPTPYGSWANLAGYDHFGNEYQHEVSPDNPY